MERMEFDLQKGWSKGLRICFEEASSSDDFNIKTALHVKQVHGDKIYDVGPEDLMKISPLAEADGMMVQGDFFRSFKRPLLIKTADCVPLILIDREAETIAIIHAGWRGLAQGIHTKLIDQGHFEPSKTWAWIGPSLSGREFEVKEDMWSQFPEHKDPTIFEPGPTSDIKYFHTWKYLEKCYDDLGLEVIYNPEVSTYSNEAFYSHRRSIHRNEERKGHNYTWLRFYE